MSRSISLTAKQALNAQQTDEAFIILLTLSHASLDQPIRVGSDGVNTVSRGDTFIAFPFDLTLPDDVDNSPRGAKLKIDNIDRTIVQAIRSINGAPTVLMEIVRASAPDTVEASFPDFKLTNVLYDSFVIEGDLTLEEFSTEPYPALVFSPSNFPGLF